MPASLDPISFANLLKSAEVTDALQEALNPMIELTIKEALKSIQQVFDAKYHQLSTVLNTVKSDISARDTLIKNLQSENQSLKERLDNLVKECDNQNQYSRRDNLLFAGLPSTTAEIAAAAVGHPTAESSDSVVTQLVSFCRDKLNVPIERNDISVAHRLKSNRSGDHPAIIAKFVNRSVRDRIYHARLKLRDINSGKAAKDMLFINEDLSDHNKALFRSARDALKKKQLASVYTSNCKVIAKKTQTSPTKIIASPEDLRLLLQP